MLNKKEELAYGGRDLSNAGRQGLGWYRRLPCQEGAKGKCLFGTPLVHACEEDRLDHKSAGQGPWRGMTGMSMDEMASKTGKDSNGDHAYL